MALRRFDSESKYLKQKLPDPVMVLIKYNSWYLNNNYNNSCKIKNTNYYAIL